MLSIPFGKLVVPGHCAFALVEACNRALLVKALLINNHRVISKLQPMAED